MAGFRQPEFARSQLVLFPTSLEDAVPVDHPVRLFQEILSSEPFEAAWEAMSQAYKLVEGRPPYHPRVLGSLWMYGMLNRIRSSRQLEMACHNRIDFMWLMEKATPDHGTISLFVKRHKPQLNEVLRSTLRVAIKAKLLGGQQLAIDGTKVEASASNDSMKKRPKLDEDLQNVEASIAKLNAEWDTNEAKEAGLREAPWTPSGNTTTQEKAALERKRLQVQAAIAALKRRQQEHAKSGARKAPAPVASVTDPDARQMRDKEGRSKPNYTPHLAVDTESGLVTAEDVNDQPWDGGGLLPMIEQSAENTQIQPTEVLADSGYNTGPALEKLEEKNIAPYMPDCGKSRPSSTERNEAIEAARNQRELTEEQKHLLLDPRTKRLSPEAFRFDGVNNVYICPAGETLRRVREHPDINVSGISLRTQYLASPESCLNCPLKAICLSSKSKSRMVTRDQYEEKREALRGRMKTEAALATYKKRTIVERTFSWLKTTGSMRKFLRRGLDNVRAEFTLACIAVNMRILLRNLKPGAIGAS